MSCDERGLRVAALKHDLAKYVAWTSANLSEDLWHGPLKQELVEALRDDILRTRKGRERVESAWEVWQAFVQSGPTIEEPELQKVESAVYRLHAAEPLIRAGDAALADEREDLRAAQTEIRVQLRNLHRRLMREES